MTLGQLKKMIILEKEVYLTDIICDFCKKDFSNSDQCGGAMYKKNEKTEIICHDCAITDNRRLLIKKSDVKTVLCGQNLKFKDFVLYCRKL